MVESDRRRKYAQRRAEKELNTANQLLDDIIKASNAGGSPRLDHLLFVAGEYRAGRTIHDAVGDEQVGEFCSAVMLAHADSLLGLRISK